MEQNFLTGKVRIGAWHVDFDSGQLSADASQAIEIAEASRRLEPKSCQVLAYLAAHPGELVTKQALTEAVWSDSYASDDTIARTISRLRTSLGDNSRAPRYIETLPKRGYRLLAEVQPLAGASPAATTPAAETPAERRPRRMLAVGVLLIAALVLVIIANLNLFTTDDDGNASPTNDKQEELLTRADDYYHQMRLADNEMAISLYQQQIELNPDAALAYAGLANSLVQRVVRWSGDTGDTPVKLTERVASGALATESAQRQLQRAKVLAEKAVNLAPENATTLKALGFVQSAQGDYQAAIETYNRALQADPAAWQVWLNQAELYGALGHEEEALDGYIAAFQAMTTRYEDNEVQIRPWYADLGNLIGDKYLASEDYQEAESWYRRVLSFAPIHEQATLGLAVVFQQTGDQPGALRLCEELKRRLQAQYACPQELAERKSRAD
ncbi:winged helix-turn-helix domain-containing protein [Pseudidiomarina aquimaris]|uniref:winged helix-turn-helix domain-containing protein n=1 Tax=Pseudidiomarina aquimaris TaxID=641841 RepID=UPI003A971E0F